MNEIKTPAIDTYHDEGTPAASKPRPQDLEENVSNSGDIKTAPDPAEQENGAANEREQKKDQRFFSQKELNRIVKREVEQALKNSKNSEFEAVQSKVAALESQIRESDLRSEVTEAAAKAGAKNPRLLFLAVKEELRFSQDGKLKNLDETIRQARRDYPELFRPYAKSTPKPGDDVKVDDDQQNHASLRMNALLKRGFKRQTSGASE